MAKYESHDFYCMNCGKKGITLPRRIGKQRNSLHRKKLWCPWCKIEVNHVECRTHADVEQFKEDFVKGVYENEKEESIRHVRSERLWQEQLYSKANCSARG